MLVRVQWLCEHSACLRGYREPLTEWHDPYVWACTLFRHSNRVELIGVVHMTETCIELYRAIVKALNAEGIYEVWMERVDEDKKIRLVRMH